MSRVLGGGEISLNWIMSQPSSRLPIGDHSSASVNDSLRSRALINSRTGIVRPVKLARFTTRVRHDKYGAAPSAEGG